MRPDKELLTLLLDRIIVNHRLTTGLCYEITQMYGIALTSREVDRLHLIIRNNRPENMGDTQYYFPMCEVTPRVTYLQKLIDKYNV